MLNETLKGIADKYGYEYRIGQEHWQNLIDAEDDRDKPFADRKKYLMFFNEREEQNMGEMGGVESERITGTFFLCIRSGIDDLSFDYKYDNHIEPLKGLAETLRDVDFKCLSAYRLRQYVIESWREDYLDTNLDCVEIRIELVNRI